MAKQLTALSIAAPGFFGLNTQESGLTLESGFALTADNCIIDKYGRLGARKGWRYVTTSGGTGANLTGAHRFIDIAGEETILSWSATKFYKGTTTLTEITPTSDNTFADGNWQCVTLNDKAYFFQRGYKPMVYDPVAGTITDVEDESNYSGRSINGTTQVPPGHTVMSAYGRLWTADLQDPSDATYYNKMTVYWSDLLDGSDWNTGSAGSIDLSAILVNGTDEIVGFGAQNGQFIVFCKRNIVVFADDSQDASFDPATMRLVEVISRVGCTARDSIQNTGIDIFFLSEDGLRSLGRVIQEKSLPMRDLSRNVRDDIVQLTADATPDDIKSVYSEDNAFYLLLFPDSERIYCFDTRAPLQDGSLRVTTWNTQTQTSMLSLANSVYFTQTNGLAEYYGYSDNSATYPFTYFTNYFDFGNSTVTKILKRIAITVIGGIGQSFIFKSGFDYTNNHRSFPASLVDASVSEFNIAEFGLTTTADAVSQAADTITNADDEHHTVDFSTTETTVYDVPITVYLDDDTYYYEADDGSRTETTLYVKSADYASEYSTGTIADIVRLAGGGSGNVLQIGFETTVNGFEISIQKLDAYIKQGRVY